MKNKKKTDVSAILDWVLLMAAYPYELTIGGPDPSGNSCRGPEAEWYVSYRRKDGARGFDGCVYAPTRCEAISKAMRLYVTQRKVERMLKAAGA